MPRLSIIIAAYNEAAYLPDQLRAIARQVRHTEYESETEIVFVDDGSTDTTLDIAQAIRRALLPSMRIMSHGYGKNQGCASATNNGAQMARGDYFCIASANDVMQPLAIQSIFRAVDMYTPPGGGMPEKAVDVVVGDVDGIRLGWVSDLSGDHGDHNSPRYLNPDQVAACFGRRGIIHAAGCAISRRAWDRHGGWDPDFWPYSETLTWHVSACRYGVVYTPNVFGWVRQHEGSASKTVLDREWRRDIMERAARFVMSLEEPARSRLVGSRLWDIAEWAPDMRPLLARASEGVISK